MSKYLLLFVTLIVSNLETRSQTTDTLCFPVPVIQKVLIAAKQKQTLDTMVNILRSDISILTEQRALLLQKDTTNKQIIQTYAGVVANYQSQVSILEKEVKKWKRKTRWTAIGGILLTGAVTFLLIK